MPQYNHDMCHCAQEQCKLKDQCYRNWLGQEIKNTDCQYASFYHPEKPAVEGCEYYINKIISNYDYTTTTRLGRIALNNRTCKR